MEKTDRLASRFFGGFYWLSGWTENFGTEPRFSLVRFLLLPAFFFLLALFFFVTRLFDTIAELPLKYQPKRLIRCLPPFVKIFLLSLHALQASDTGVIVLDRGEATEINMQNVVNYSVTQNNAISYKYLSRKKMMVIKAKEGGLSQVILWEKGGKSRKITIFVRPKNLRLRHAEFISLLHSLGLRTANKERGMEVKGTIGNLGHYEAFSTVVNHQKDDFFTFAVAVEEGILKRAIADIYFDFFQHYRDSISCRYQSFTIFCTYFYADQEEKELQKKWEQKYAVKFTVYKKKYPTNFKITTKTVLIEAQGNLELGTGLDGISATIDEVLENDVEQLFAHRQIGIGSGKVDIYSFNEQESLIRVDHPLEIRIGADQLYHNEVQGETRTYRHFTGLRIDLVLKRTMERFSIDYDTSLSSPTSDNQSRRNSKKSSFFIRPGFFEKVFEIRTTAKGLTEAGLPILSGIPLLGYVFKQTSKSNSRILYRTYVKLEKP